MNRNPVLLVAALLLANVSVGLGQSENVILKKPPIGSSWSLKIERPQGSSKVEEALPKQEDGGEKVARVEKESLPTGFVMKTGTNGISVGQVSYSEGMQETFYMAQGLLFAKASNTGKIFATPAGNNDLHSLKVAGFPGTAWISSVYQAGMQTRQEQECHYFLYDVPEGDPERPAMKMEAWVQKNGYPLEIIIHGEMTYHFGKVSPFDQEIQLPDAYRTVFAQRKKQMDALDLIRKANQVK